jgi:hypothetical protein
MDKTLCRFIGSGRMRFSLFCSQSFFGVSA